jgi:hypothetical protein
MEFMALAGSSGSISRQHGKGWRHFKAGWGNLSMGLVVSSAIDLQTMLMEESNKEVRQLLTTIVLREYPYSGFPHLKKKNGRIPQDRKPEIDGTRTEPDECPTRQARERCSAGAVSIYCLDAFCLASHRIVLRRIRRRWNSAVIIEVLPRFSGTLFSLHYGN